MQNISEVFQKAGFEVQPYIPREMSPEEVERAQKADAAVKDYLKKLKKAREVSQNSTLRFCQKTGREKSEVDFVCRHLRMMDKVRYETDESVKHFHHYAKVGTVATRFGIRSPLRASQRIKD